MNKNLVLPLNYRKRERYISDFRKIPPPQVSAILVVAYPWGITPPADKLIVEQLAEGVRAANESVSVQDLLEASGPLYTANITLGAVTSPDVPGFRESMSEAEQDWIYDGISLEMVFFAGDRATKSQQIGGFIGMRYLNRWHVSTCSVEPADHYPMRIEGIPVASYRHSIGDMFERGIGMWSQYVADARTRSLVFGRAILQGRDPVSEWKRFRAAGGQLHFDYPRLCP